jgi:membrane protease subunit (stomatin/prohibitin family)
MEVAPSTVITFDLYNKLCGLSGKFKELFSKGQQENPTPAYAAAGSGMERAGTSTNEKPVFCGECGAKNAKGTKFCGECGAKLG